MAENLDVFGFALTGAEMKAIGRLDEGRSEIIDHRSPRTAKWLNEWHIHE